MRKKLLQATFLAGLLAAGTSQAANFYSYSGEITSCPASAFCTAPVITGSAITAELELATIQGATVGDNAVIDYLFTITSDSPPLESTFYPLLGNNGSDGSSITLGTPTIDNPAGLTGALVFQLLDDPAVDPSPGFEAAGLYVIIDLATGNGQTCAQYVAAGRTCTATGTNPNEIAAFEGQFVVSEVPLPAAAWLFISAIGGLGVVKRFRK